MVTVLTFPLLTSGFMVTSLSRQSTPVRTESCAHIQTFDLHSAVFSLTLSEMFKNKNWFNAIMSSPLRKGYAVHELWYENNFRCPVCRLTGPLYIDLTVTAALACFLREVVDFHCLLGALFQRNGPGPSLLRRE